MSIWPISIRRITARSYVLTLVFSSAILFAQSHADSPIQEFPVTLRQKIVAGQTPVGTKVEANLSIATLMSGKVIPVGATFTGEVVESSARSAGHPSHLAIRMDSVRWKKGSADVKTYLTAWYYPLQNPLEDRSNEPSGIHGEIGMQRGGPQPPPASEPYPGRSSNGTDLPPVPTSHLSDHRVVMKDVDSENKTDGSITISSSHFDIKLDRSTTYVLATGGLSTGK